MTHWVQENTFKKNAHDGNKFLTKHDSNADILKN